MTFQFPNKYKFKFASYGNKKYKLKKKEVNKYLNIIGWIDHIVDNPLREDLCNARQADQPTRPQPSVYGDNQNQS